MNLQNIWGRALDRVLMNNSPSNILFNPSNAEATFAKAQGNKKVWKPTKSSHVGIYWKALAEYSQMSTHMPGSHFLKVFLHHFSLVKLGTTSIIKT